MVHVCVQLDVAVCVWLIRCMYMCKWMLQCVQVDVAVYMWSIRFMYVYKWAWQYMCGQLGSCMYASCCVWWIRYMYVCEWL